MEDMNTIKIVLESSEYPDIEICTMHAGEIRINQDKDGVLMEQSHLKSFIDALQLFL